MKEKIEQADSLVSLVYEGIKIFGSKSALARELGYTGRGRSHHITNILEGKQNLPKHKISRLLNLVELARRLT